MSSSSSWTGSSTLPNLKNSPRSDPNPPPRPKFAFSSSGAQTARVAPSLPGIGVLRVVQPFSPSTVSPRKGHPTKPAKMVPIPPSVLPPPTLTREQAASAQVGALMQAIRNPLSRPAMADDYKVDPGDRQQTARGGGGGVLTVADTTASESRSLVVRAPTDGCDEGQELSEMEKLSIEAVENSERLRERNLRTARLQKPTDFSRFIASLGSEAPSGRPSAATSLVVGQQHRDKAAADASLVSTSRLKKHVEGFGKVLEDLCALMPDYVSALIHAKRFTVQLFTLLSAERASHAAAEGVARKAIEEEQRQFYEGKLVELLQDRRRLTSHIIALNKEIASYKSSRDDELRTVKKDVLDTLEKFSREDATGGLQRAMTSQAFQTNIALMDRVYNLCAFIRASGLQVPGSHGDHDDAVKRDIFFGKRAAVLPTLGSYLDGGKRRSRRGGASIASMGSETDRGAFEEMSASLQDGGAHTSNEPQEILKVEEQVGPQFIEASKRELERCRLSNQQMLISTASDSQRTYRLLLGHKDTEIEGLKQEVKALNDKIENLQRQIDEQHFDLFKQQQAAMNAKQGRRLSLEGPNLPSSLPQQGITGGNGGNAPVVKAPLKSSQLSEPNSALIKRHFTNLSAQISSSGGGGVTGGDVAPSVPDATSYDPLRPSTPRPWVPFTVQSTLGINIRQPTATLVHELATVALNFKAEMEEVHVSRKRLVAQLSYVDSLAFPPPNHPSDPPFLSTITEEDWATIPHFLRTRVTPHVVNSTWGPEFTAHLVRKFFEGFDMYRDMSVYRRDHKMVEPRVVLVKDRRKHVMQTFDVSPRQLNEIMERTRLRELDEPFAFPKTVGRVGGLTSEMLSLEARAVSSLTDSFDHSSSAPTSRAAKPSAPTDRMLQAAKAALPIGYVVTTFLLYEMQEKLYKHRLIPVGVRGAFQYNREDFVVEGELTKLAYNLWHSVRKFRQTEPLCDMFVRVVEGDVPPNIFEHSQNAASVLHWRISAQDPSGSGLVTYPQISAAILSIASEQPFGVWKQLLYAVSQTMKDSHIPLHGRIPIATLFANENNYQNVGDRQNAITVPTQIAGSSLLVKSLNRVVIHKFCDLFAVLEAILLPLVRESSLVPGMAVLSIPHAMQRVRQYQEEFASHDYADAVQYGLVTLASRAPGASSKLASGDSSLASTRNGASHRPPIALTSQFASNATQQFELIEAREASLAAAKGVPGSTLTADDLAPSAVGALSQYLAGYGAMGSGDGGFSHSFFATHKHPITSGGDNDLGEPSQSMFGDGHTHTGGSSAAVPYVPTSTFFHCELAALVEEVGNELPRMNASMHLLEEAVKNTRKKRRKSFKGPRRSGDSSSSKTGDIPLTGGSERRSTLQPGGDSGTLNAGGDRPKPTAIKRITAVSVANAKDDQELVEWYHFTRLLRTHIRPLDSLHAETHPTNRVSLSGDVKFGGGATKVDAAAPTRMPSRSYALGAPYFMDLLFKEVPHLEGMLANHVAAKKRRAGGGFTASPTSGAEASNTSLGEIIHERQQGPPSELGSGVASRGSDGFTSPPPARDATPEGEDSA